MILSTVHDLHTTVSQLGSRQTPCLCREALRLHKNSNLFRFERIKMPFRKDSTTSGRFLNPKRSLWWKCDGNIKTIKTQVLRESIYSLLSVQHYKSHDCNGIKTHHLQQAILRQMYNQGTRQITKRHRHANPAIQPKRMKTEWVRQEIMTKRERIIKTITNLIRSSSKTRNCKNRKKLLRWTKLKNTSLLPWTKQKEITKN